MGKLNQVIAAEKGIKTSVEKEITELHHQVQKPALLTGISKTYRTRDEEGEVLPPEHNKVQLNASDVLKAATQRWSELFDVTATKDHGNKFANADIVAEGKVIATAVPVTTLLFIEKQLVNIATFVRKLPILDPSEDWEWDDNQGCYVTEPVETHRTKKVPRNHVKAPATDKHPAQVDVYTEDVIVGYWKTTKHSGAIPASRQKELLSRVEALQVAVKAAREEANGAEVTQQKIAGGIFDYLLK